ncbi:MAG: twin-arginine translocase TatA/TatE family subunit [Candidatus Pedobacter colombiensis]|uniref:Sec-independent protein translocase protein TatA n=1 Tax=Candidatus Pedobacter colombiensis TaxID=3121371 RepID=A0AAJ5WCC1_9SPHI|nr:twin-arginine translocase TatA/TatE family subunit [Pedobacter sp.]WEK21418.1 MAG: twin-arginine translocase TatA/TatE family subunit [Pedobacter sp.]
MYTGTLIEFLNMGGGEIMLILVVILLLFGGKKLPELARGLGQGLRDFKDASEGVKREIHRNINAVEPREDLSPKAGERTAESGKASSEATENNDLNKGSAAKESTGDNPG